MKANPTTVAQRHYYVQMTLATFSYLLILFGTRAAMAHLSGPSRAVAAILPVLPVILVLVAVIRLVRNTDEFNRRILVDSLAISAGVTAMFCATYGFMEIDLLPRLSIWWIWTVLMGSWLIASLVLRLRYR